MNYPEVLLVPAFMLLDYFLTIVGRIQNEKEYGKHFKIESYELNPSWQADIANKHWINRRHLMTVLGMTIFFVFFLELAGTRKSFAEFALGFVLVMYGTVIGRHLSNIALFTAIARNPQLASGQVSLKQQYLMINSMWGTLAVLLPLVTLTLISPSAYLVGGVFGALYLMVIHLVWLQKSAQ